MRVFIFLLVRGAARNLFLYNISLVFSKKWINVVLEIKKYNSGGFNLLLVRPNTYNEIESAVKRSRVVWPWPNYFPGPEINSYHEQTMHKRYFIWKGTKTIAVIDSQKKLIQR